MDIKNEKGKLKTLEELEYEVLDLIVDALDCMSEWDALCLGNEYRDRNSYSRLYKNRESDINEALEGESPWDILNCGWDDCYDYFTYEYDLNMTNDVWEDVDTSDLARDILNGSYSHYLNSDISDILDEYEEAKEEIENYNPYRAMCEEVIQRYVNCEADVTDLLQTLDKLAKEDDAWEEN